VLFPAADLVVLTEPRQPRAISAPLLAEMTSHLAEKSIVVPNPGEALERAIATASPEDAVFATGSLYLVGDLRTYWRLRSAPAAAQKS
jgi:dihydrofolate synthase/folylpolyglutamate synthase